MTELKFRSDMEFLYYDKSLGASLTLLADWYVRADTDDEHYKTTIPLQTDMTLTDILNGYNGDVPFRELTDKYGEIGDTVSEKLTEKMQFSCVATLTALTPDESSARLIEQIEKMKKFSDPAYAAAEFERAMKQAQETAEKNGMSVQDIQNIQNAPLPDLPPLPDTSDPLERAKAITARVEQMKQMSMNGSFAAAPAAAAVAAPAAPAPAAPAAPFIQRPKFCASCGSRLPESGNFCPDCGAKI